MRPDVFRRFCASKKTKRDDVRQSTRARNPQRARDSPHHESRRTARVSARARTHASSNTHARAPHAHTHTHRRTYLLRDVSRHPHHARLALLGALQGHLQAHILLLRRRGDDERAARGRVAVRGRRRRGAQRGGTGDGRARGEHGGVRRRGMARQTRRAIKLGLDGRRAGRVNPS